MSFIDYLKERHSIVPGTKEIKEISARQYNSRLISMIAQNIYYEGSEINEQTVEKINNKYVNKTKEYERTIRYYLEYKVYSETMKS